MLAKRVLIATPLYPPDIGGPATYAKLLMDELTHYGFAVKFISFGQVRDLPRLVRHWRYFLRVLKKGRQADLIFALDPVSVGLPALIAAKILRKKFLVKIVGDFAWEQYKQNFSFGSPDLEEFQRNKYDWLTELRRKIQKFVARRADKVIVPSQYLAKIILGWGARPEKVRVIYNAFDPPVIEGERPQLKSFLNLSGPTLISAGRLVPWKGFTTLIKLLPDLAKEFPDIKLLIAGDGPDRKALEELIGKLNLADKVKLLGALPRQELLPYLKTADLFVLNTGYEGFSHQLLEVMSLGTPIITTLVGGNLELIEDGRDGILLPYNGREAFLVAIVALLKDKKKREILSWNAKYKIKQFSQEKMLEKLIQELQ